MGLYANGLLKNLKNGNVSRLMIIKGIEAIGQSDEAIRSRLGDLLEKGGHRLFICDTRGMTDADLIKNVSDADILLLSNRPLFKGSDRGLPQAQADLRGVYRYRY
jgi:hypothetical protein